MTATVDDVRDLIATELGDPEVQTWLDRTDRAVAREYDTDAFESEQHRDDLVAPLTAYRIISGHGIADRRRYRSGPRRKRTISGRPISSGG